jgi:hypothetical protein
MGRKGYYTVVDNCTLAAENFLPTIIPHAEAVKWTRQTRVRSNKQAYEVFMHPDLTRKLYSLSAVRDMYEDAIAKKTTQATPAPEKKLEDPGREEFLLPEVRNPEELECDAMIIAILQPKQIHFVSEALLIRSWKTCASRGMRSRLLRGIASPSAGILSEILGMHLFATLSSEAHPYRVEHFKEFLDVLMENERGSTVNAVLRAPRLKQLVMETHLHCMERTIMDQQKKDDDSATQQQPQRQSLLLILSVVMGSTEFVRHVRRRLDPSQRELTVASCVAGDGLK